MNILLVMETGADGAFRHVESWIHYLVARGEKPHLAYSSIRGRESLDRLVEFVKKQGGETWDMRVVSAPRPKDLRTLIGLAGMARRVNAEIVHGHSSKGGGLVRLLALLQPGRHYFYTPHAYYGMGRDQSFKTEFFNWMERLLGKVGTTIHISEDESRFGREVLGVQKEKCRIVHNPVDSGRFVPVDLEAKGEARRRLAIPETALVVGSMGRLVAQKDPLTLYRALAPVFLKQENLFLYHIGLGPLDVELAALARELGIEKWIIRRDYMEDPRDFYRVIDLLMMTSTYEAGWPLVVLEAMACDLPFVCSLAPGTSNLGSGGLSHCWTAPAGKVKEFSLAVEAWLADLAAGRPSNHRAVILERFSIDACYGAVFDLYQKALEKN